MLAADCAKATWSATETFLPVYKQGGAALTIASTSFIGNLESISDFTYGSEIQEINIASLLGATGTVEGVSKGSGTFVVIHDSAKPIGGTLGAAGYGILSGGVYDFVVTVGFTVPDAAAVDAEGTITGRCRIGQVGFPVMLSGEVIRINLPFITDGRCFGDLVGAPVV